MSQEKQMLSMMLEEHGIEASAYQVSLYDQEIKQKLKQKEVDLMFERETEDAIAYPQIKLYSSMFINTKLLTNNEHFRYSSSLVISKPTEYPKYFDVFHYTTRPEEESTVLKQILTFCKLNGINIKCLIRSNKVNLFSPPYTEEFGCKEIFLKKGRKMPVLVVDWEKV